MRRQQMGAMEASSLGTLASLVGGTAGLRNACLWASPHACLCKISLKDGLPWAEICTFRMDDRASQPAALLMCLPFPRCRRAQAGACSGRHRLGILCGSALLRGAGALARHGACKPGSLGSVAAPRLCGVIHAAAFCPTHVLCRWSSSGGSRAAATTLAATAGWFWRAPSRRIITRFGRLCTRSTTSADRTVIHSCSNTG